MKKTLLLVALSLALMGTWSFAPAPFPPRTYMQVIFVASGMGSGYLTLIDPAGKVTKADLKYTEGNNIKGKLLLKLNELSQQGWEVVQMQTADPTPGYLRETYLLEKH